MVIANNSGLEEMTAAYPALSRTFIQEGIPCRVCGECSWGTIEDPLRCCGKNNRSSVQKLNDRRRGFLYETA